MNHTSKTARPSRPSPAPGAPGTPACRPGKRPWPARLFALGAVLLLVVSGLVVVISGMMRGPSPQDAAQAQSAYAADALGRINDLGTLADASRGLPPAVPGDVAQAEVEALASELAAAQARLEWALAQVEQLPQVPEGYVPGLDLGVELPPAQVAKYEVPTFDGALSLGEYVPGGVAGDGSPVSPRDGLHAPATGHPLVDDALAQLVGACDALRDLIGSAGGAPVPAGTVPVGVPTDPCALDGVEGLPTSPGSVLGDGLGEDPTGGLLSLLPTDPTGLLSGPTPGADPSGEVQDANDALDPDELGALAAQDHAGRILGITGTAYARANATLRDLLAGYGGLAMQLQDLVADARAQAAGAEEAVPAILNERLASIMSQAAQLRSDATRIAHGMRSAAEKEADVALATVQDAAKAHVSGLQAKLDEAVRSINARATATVALAESRAGQVRSLVDSAVADLARMSAESGVDAAAQVAAIRAAGDAAVQALEAEAKAEVETLKAQAAGLQARAQAAVPRMAAMAMRAADAVNATRADALDEAERAKSFALDYITAHATLLEQAESRAATAALAGLQASLEAYVDGLKDRALALVEDVPDVVGATSTLVGDATVLAQDEVGKDVAYILKVADDYGSVPTAERRARALYWDTVGDAGGQALVVLDAAGDRLTVLAAQVQAAADGARGQVEMVAESL